MKKKNPHFILETNARHKVSTIPMDQNLMVLLHAEIHAEIQASLSHMEELGIQKSWGQFVSCLFLSLASEETGPVESLSDI